MVAILLVNYNLLSLPFFFIYLFISSIMWHGDPMLVNKKSSVYFDLLSIHTIISNSMSQFQCVRTAFKCKSYPFLKLSE